VHCAQASEIDEEKQNASRASRANKISNELNLREKAQMLRFKSTSTPRRLLLLAPPAAVACINLTWHNTACFSFSLPMSSVQCEDHSLSHIVLSAAAAAAEYNLSLCFLSLHFFSH
jgi:hypothetical protein